MRAKVVAAEKAIGALTSSYRKITFLVFRSLVEGKGFSRIKDFPERLRILEIALEILGDAKAAINYENKYTLDYARWRKANPNAYSPFDTVEFNEQWLKQNKLDDFKKEAARNIGYVGQKLPANLSEATHGQAYYLPEQKEVRYLDIRRKDASGKTAPGFVKNDPLAGNVGQ
jgi:hypothetical protein